MTLINRGFNSLHFSWGNVPCDSTGGGIILLYKYDVKNKNGSIIYSGSTVDNTVLIDGLADCGRFAFEVAAITTAGSGPSNTLWAETEKQGVYKAHLYSVLFLCV